MKRFIVGVIAAVLSVTAVWLSAQNSPSPAPPLNAQGGRGGQASGGCAGAGRGRVVPSTSISGFTGQADSSERLPYVSVTLVPTDPPSPGTPLCNIQVVSDQNGEFIFPTVPSGHYALFADREGFLRQDRFQSGPNAPSGSLLTAMAGQKLEGLIVVLNSVPAISGIAYGADGRRLAAAVIQALRVQYTPFGRRLLRVASVLSHEGGEYRLFHMTQGYYVVAASYSEQALRPWQSILELSPNLPHPDDGYSTVYFPNALALADAKLVSLSGASGAKDIDIIFKETRYFRLTIKLNLPPNRSINASVALLPLGADLDAAPDYRISGAGANFSVDRLPEGDYVLAAFVEDRDAAGNSTRKILSDTVPVHVSDSTDVTLDIVDPFRISGNVTGVVSRGLPAPMQVQLVRVDRFSTRTLRANVDGSGGFQLLDVGPGTYDVFLKGMPANAYLREAGFSYADRQLLQVRIDGSKPPRIFVKDPAPPYVEYLLSTENLAVALSLSGGSANGKVTNRGGNTFPGAEVVLVPTGATARLRTDRYYTASSDASGSFQLQGIQPGDYTAYAFQKIEAGLYFDPDFNTQIGARGTSVNIGPTAGRPLNLIVITADDIAGLVR